MSLRDEILAALTDHAGGLTAKQIAKLCPSCEYCQVTVGAMVSTMCRENVIYRDGFRLGESLYFFGAPPKQEGPVNEPRLPTPVTPKEAARGVLALRTQKTAPEQAPSRPTSSTAQTTTAQAQAAVPQEGEMTIRDKIEAALEKHGPMDVPTLRKHVKVEGLGGVASAICKRGVIRKLGGGAKSTIYGLPGQKLADQVPEGDALKKGGDLGRKAPQKQSKKKKRTGPAKPPKPAHTPPKPAQPINGAEHDSAVFAINEVGELGIEKDKKMVKLDRAELYRLRQFIERCSPILEGADA